MSVLIKRCAALLLAVNLGACSGISGVDLFSRDFWSNGPANKNSLAELGIAEMAKGNYVSAEGFYKRALKKDAKDVQALMGLGIIYQNTGQNTQARQMYEAIIAIRPPDSEQFVVWKNISTQPISKIASVNLALLESGGVLSEMRRGDSKNNNLVNRPKNPEAHASPGKGLSASSIATPMPPILADGDANIVSRFKTMIALRDQGLITQEEFKARRQANIGSLLPLTSPPPATGMDRSVPSSEQISGRLRAIGRALELRAMTVSQHSAERSMILDALMPAAPVSVANPAPPPKGLLEAADAVRRLEQLKARGLITSDEYSKERAAIERSMQPAPMARSMSTSAAAKRIKPSSPAEFGTPGMKRRRPQPAVHLASYRSRKSAGRGWIQLRRAYKSLLGKLVSNISRVNLGPGKGIFYRLKAGPLASENDARKICRKLKRRRQYCQPSFMNAK